MRCRARTGMSSLLLRCSVGVLDEAREARARAQNCPYRHAIVQNSCTRSQFRQGSSREGGCTQLVGASGIKPVIAAQFRGYIRVNAVNHGFGAALTC